mgnify:CR=1 FL=1
MGRWKVIAILGAAQFIMVLDTTVMNVSVSSVVEDLDTSITQVQLAITLYTLVMGSLMLLGGKFGDIFGRKKVFGIGLVIYGTGSMITAISPNINVLLFGWSFVEGFGAVLVIPAIVALAAANYEGRDRATAYGVLGGVTAAGAAAGPLIGGWVTEAWTWRVVFASETFVCLGIMLTMRTIADSARAEIDRRIDWLGAFLSALGLALIVLAILKASEWGFLLPKEALTIGGTEITPFGLSAVPFMIGAGVAVMFGFAAWERRLGARGGAPLMHPEILRNVHLRAGLAMLGAQQVVIAGVFFVLPIYLQYVLLQSAFETGVKIMPMSIAMLIGAGMGPRLAVTKSPKWIVSIGLYLVAAGAAVLMASISPELNSPVFAGGLALFGAGAGLIASQLGNVIMSSVSDSERGEAGGLQGTSQNLGSSLGVALIGAILLSSLGSGLNTRVAEDPAISVETKQLVSQGTEGGVDIYTRAQVEEIADAAPVSDADAEKVVDYYVEAQLDSLKIALLFAGFLALLGLAATRNLPTVPGVELGADADDSAPTSG